MTSGLRAALAMSEASALVWISRSVAWVFAGLRVRDGLDDLDELRDEGLEERGGLEGVLDELGHVSDDAAGADDQLVEAAAHERDDDREGAAVDGLDEDDAGELLDDLHRLLGAPSPVPPVGRIRRRTAGKPSRRLG